MVGRIVVLLAIACYVDANASEATPPVCDKIFAAAASLVQNKNQGVSEAKLRDSLPSVDAAKSASGTPQAVLLEAMHAMLGEVYEGPTPEMTVYSTYRAEVCVRNLGRKSTPPDFALVRPMLEKCARASSKEKSIACAMQAAGSSDNEK